MRHSHRVLQRMAERVPVIQCGSQVVLPRVQFDNFRLQLYTPMRESLVIRVFQQSRESLMVEHLENLVDFCKSFKPEIIGPGFCHYWRNEHYLRRVERSQSIFASLVINCGFTSYGSIDLS